MRAAAALTLLVLVGCDDGGPGATIRPDAAPADAAPPDAAPVPVDTSRKICDGSDGLRFSVRSGGGFLGAPPQNLLSELGTFLFVDGHCRYWVSGPTSDSQPTHAGVLDVAQEAELTAATYFQSWATLAEPFTCTMLPPADGGSTRFTDGTIDVTCPYCESVVRPELTAACAAGHDLRTAFWNAGTPLDGPVRIYVRDGTQADQLGEVDWPLAQDPAELLAASATTPIEIDDLDQASVLRALVRAHDTAHPTRAGDGAPVRTTDGRHFVLHLRDRLPFEDGAGHVAF